MRRKTGQVLVGEGHQQMHATDTGIQVSDTMQHKHTGYVLWRALVWLMYTEALRWAIRCFSLHARPPTIGSEKNQQKPIVCGQF